MKLSCELCHRLYDEDFKAVNIIFNGKEFNIRDISRFDRSYKLCRDCLKAVIFGASFDERNMMRLNEHI